MTLINGSIEFSTAGRYAKALFAASENYGHTAEIKNFLKNMVDRLETQKTINFYEVFLETKQPSLEANHFEKLEKIPSYLANFIAIILKNKRIKLLAQIYMVFSQLLQKKNKRLHVCVHTATALTQYKQHNLSNWIKSNINQDCDFIFEHKKNLIKGFCIIFDNDIIYDASWFSQRLLIQNI